ncbi:hypothetical protein GE253_14010 [Niveispirillum sp. SYP-B3756]|uniref:hypothetical protein n=1 Tax=Niveispirillum sp. SYP-B3756 TaxID=2662178 RepID=UPI0012915444|nr:hypothetical protein [Niveispirillum sp. SYP-B3756]MQP66447.1 hypothetical protein [Niveispirillum sp. SYP-B3756]
MANLLTAGFSLSGSISAMAPIPRQTAGATMQDSDKAAKHPIRFARSSSQRLKRVFLVLPTAPTPGFGDNDSVHYRSLNRAEHLAANGINAMVCTIETLSGADMNAGDAAIFQHPVVSPHLRQMVDSIQRSNATAVADIDTHNIDISLAMRGPAGRLDIHSREQILADLAARTEALQLFSTVIVPDEPLAMRIRQLCPAGRIQVVPDVPVPAEIALAEAMRTLPEAMAERAYVACLGQPEELAEILPVLAPRLIPILSAAGLTLLVQVNVTVPPVLLQSGRVRPILPANPQDQPALLRVCRSLAFLTTSADTSGIIAWRAFIQATLAGIPFLGLSTPSLADRLGGAGRLVENLDEWLGCLSAVPARTKRRPPAAAGSLMRKFPVHKAHRKLMAALGN